MDAISRFIDWLLTLLGNLNPVIQSGFIREALILGFGCLLPALAFIQGNRSTLIQRLLFAIGIIVGSVLPFDWLLTWQPKFKAYLMVVCLLGLITFPFVIPFFIARTAGGEKTTRWSIAVAVVVLFLINLIVHWLK